MKYWIVAATCVGCLVVGHTIGRQQGLREAPAMVAYQKERDAYYDAQFEEMLHAPDGRELVCAQIFELVESELSVEAIEVQAELSE